MLIGCGLRVLRAGRSTALRVGAGMVPRGEVALIVAAVGLQSETLPQSTYAIVVAMTVVTRLIAALWLRRSFLPERATPAVPAPSSGLQV
jgi:Kef-type K+ transport system membrane component KefB